jgi:hypothetical protein
MARQWTPSMTAQVDQALADARAAARELAALLDRDTQRHGDERATVMLAETLYEHCIARPEQSASMFAAAVAMLRDGSSR